MQETEPNIQEKLLAALEEGRPVDVIRQLVLLHPSEIADLLESLPKKDRDAVWNLIPLRQKGEVLSHAQDTIRAGLLEQMDPDEIAYATRWLDLDDIADILHVLPEKFADNVLLSMDVQDRERLASVLSYPEDTAGGLMNPDIVSVRADVSLDVVARYLRQKGSLPEQTDSLMVVAAAYRVADQGSGGNRGRISCLRDQFPCRNFRRGSGEGLRTA